MLDPAIAGDLEVLAKVADGRVRDRRAARSTTRPGSSPTCSDDGPVTLLPLRPHGEEGDVPVHQPPGARGQAAGPMHPRVDQVARRPRPGELPDAAARRRPRRRRRAGGAGCRWCCSSTAARGRATTGASTPTHQWLANRGYAVLSRQLPRLDRLRQEVPQRRQPRVGRQDARRPDRRRRLGRRRRRSPTRRRSRSWAAATAATRRWSASPSRRRCSPAASTSSARRTS